ncbi:MAG TPA: exodeoxyribonuclease III [Candidatus Limnocylindrales bacterium]|nr:exodeoxyribonuclease III [Candidatus Limnocylindrales bacterium]
MTRIVSWNINGIRASAKSGFFDFLERELPDILCLQEIKARPDQIAAEHLERLEKLGYTAHWHPATKAGYSGVATLSRKQPLFVTYGLDFEREEGRILVSEHGDFTLYNIYFPNGRQTPSGPDPERLAFKLAFYESVLEVLEEERAEGKHLVVCGDFNTAHEEIDIARPQENRGTTGFLSEERAALGKYMKTGWIDTFRHFHPARLYEGRAPHERDYTWWSNRIGVRERNIGWRIDYHFVNREFLPAVKAAAIWDEVYGSDHCPVVVDLNV